MLTLENSIYVTLGNGNPGALSVIMKLIMTPDGEKVLHALSMQNIRGWEIWVIYKDICQCDITLMIKKVLDNDEVIHKVLSKERLAMARADAIFGKDE